MKNKTEKEKESVQTWPAGKHNVVSCIDSFSSINCENVCTYLSGCAKSARFYMSTCMDLCVPTKHAHMLIFHFLLLEVNSKPLLGVL